jgi:hypothetical protein
MKKALLIISIVFVFGITMAGCATKSDIAKMQADDQQINLKADQALKASQEANENAMKAAEAVKAAEERAQAAEERAALAEAKAEKANAMFRGSMKK